MCTYHIHTQQRANFKDQTNKNVQFNWKKHVQEKIKQIKTIRKSMYWLKLRNSKLNVKNKLLIYKIIIKPIWTYEHKKDRKSISTVLGMLNGMSETMT